MKITIGFLLACIVATSAGAQTPFDRQLDDFREAHKKELLASSNAPLKSEEDLSYLRFYAPDSSYRVVARVERLTGVEPFEMPTYNGQTRPHVAYARLLFVLHGKPLTLTVYRNLNVIRQPAYRDYLFLPFKDATSGQETYGGGRYIDLRIADVRNNELLLDFNKAYNPYCAYHEGYPCPIPPEANELPVAVEVGEKAYGKGH